MRVLFAASLQYTAALVSVALAEFSLLSVVAGHLQFVMPHHGVQRSAAKGGVERRVQSKKSAEALLVGLRGPAMHRAATRQGNVPEQTVPVA